MGTCHLRLQRLVSPLKVRELQLGMFPIFSLHLKMSLQPFNLFRGLELHV